MQITHTTTLNYSDPIAETVMELRMAPRQSTHQHRLAFALAVGPAASVSSYFDFQGNQVYVFTIAPFHKEVQIVATSVVDTHRPAVQLRNLPDTWPLRDLDYSFYDYLLLPAAGPVAECSALRELAALVRATRGMLLSNVAMGLLELVHTRFVYEKGVTTSSTPIMDVLTHRRGVCQDFTHVMIAVARALGIPARYVSGVIHCGDDSLRGAAQTHAWCELYFPSTGWVGLDPTNNALVDDRFVTIAHGRDYRDVPPNRGVYKGKAKESIDVSVMTTTLNGLPQQLGGDRIVALRLETLADGPDAALLRTGQLEEQQQQQQQE